MKKILCILLAVLMAFSLVSCGKESPERATNNALKAVKNLNVIGLTKYFGEVSVEEIELDSISAADLKVVKKFTSKMSWEILGSVEYGDTATVTVRLTAVDAAPLVSAVAGDILGNALSSLFGNGASEEEMHAKVLERLDEELSKEDVKMKTSDIELDLIKHENSWRIELDDSIFGSFIGSFDLF